MAKAGHVRVIAKKRNGGVQTFWVFVPDLDSVSRIADVDEEVEKVLGEGAEVYTYDVCVRCRDGVKHVQHVRLGEEASGI